MGKDEWVLGRFYEIMNWPGRSLWISKMHRLYFSDLELMQSAFLPSLRHAQVKLQIGTLLIFGCLFSIREQKQAT